MSPVYERPHVYSQVTVVAHAGGVCLEQKYAPV